MKTEVVMKRTLFGEEISQKSKSEFFSATDLVKAGNKWRVQQGMQPFNLNKHFNKEQTKEFINELEKEFSNVKISGRGRGHHTWVHPYLFIDIALAINPKLKIQVYKWLYDFLLKYRNDSGDSFKKMAGALYENTTKKSTFSKSMVKVADIIRESCGVNDWQKATEEQLKLRDKIQNNIALLCDVLKDNNHAINVGIDKALKS